MSNLISPIEGQTVKKTLGFLEMIKSASAIAAAECVKAGIPFKTPLLVGITSGFDVALTLLEESVTQYRGFTREGAKRVFTYFQAEAERSKSVDQQIAIWYLAWATVIEAEYITLPPMDHP